MKPKAERRCQLLFGVALVLLTIGIGYCTLVGTCLADFAVVVAGLFVGWVAFIYCLANASFWGSADG
jgi:uncharacterized membrane protein